MARRFVGVGSDNDHQQPRLAGEGTPCLGPIEEPTPFGRCALQGKARDIGPEVWFGNGDGAQRVARRQFWKPMGLLRFGATGQQRTRQDFRACDRTARSRERGLGQRFGYHNHQQRVFPLGGGTATVLLRNGQAEDAHLAHGLKQTLGHCQIGAMNLLRHRRNNVSCKAPKRILCHCQRLVQRQLTHLVARVSHHSLGGEEIGTCQRDFVAGELLFVQALRIELVPQRAFHCQDRDCLIEQHMQATQDGGCERKAVAGGR